MREPALLMAAASQAISYMLGGLVIALALGVMTTSVSAPEITTWAWDVLGLAFAALLGSLVFIALFCWVKIKQLQGRGGDYLPWLVAGIQAANGIATLALTYTLLGISLGIGSLAGQQLTPETIQGVIKGLTENFSMAFMTTVVGLPTSALLRSLLLVADARKSPTALRVAAAAKQGEWRSS
jgi:hypothetical protein